MGLRWLGMRVNPRWLGITGLGVGYIKKPPGIVSQSTSGSARVVHLGPIYAVDIRSFNRPLSLYYRETDCFMLSRRSSTTFSIIGLWLAGASAIFRDNLFAAAELLLPGALVEPLDGLASSKSPSSRVRNHRRGLS